MLEPVSRRWAWPTLALALVLSVAPAAATLDSEAAEQEVHDAERQAAAQSTQVAAEAGTVLAGLPDPQEPQEPQEEDPESGSSGPGQGGSGSGGSPPSGGPSQPPRRSYRPVVPAPPPVPDVPLKEAERLVAPVRELLPGDPVQLARDTAEQAQAIPMGILEPDEAEPSEPAPAPQGAAAPPVGPSALAATAVVLVAAGAATAATFVGFWLAGSSGAVGSKAAASAASRIGDLRGLLPFASPLFTRFERDTVLGHPRREALYALILQEPGISLQALGDATGLSRTAVIHHLRLLERQHLIVSRRVGRSRHYFENGGRYGHDQKEAYAVLQNDRSKAVAEYIKGNPGSMQKALCAALGIQPSIAHWHVRRLEEAHIVETVRQGRTVAYFPGPGLVAMQAASASAAVPSAPVQPAATA